MPTIGGMRRSFELVALSVAIRLKIKIRHWLSGRLGLHGQSAPFAVAIQVHEHQNSHSRNLRVRPLRPALPTSIVLFELVVFWATFRISSIKRI
ncbi:MAG: hypothetical protein AAF509_17600 [Pseudomonadota bacterium]